MAVIAAALVRIALRHDPLVVVPAPVVSVSASPVVVKVLVPSDVSKLSQDSHRALILHRQPDGAWHEIGHSDFESRENPGERITRELATEGRAILWPDGTMQES